MTSLSLEAVLEDARPPDETGSPGLWHEPRIALAVLQAMLAPYLSGGQLTILFGHDPDSGRFRW